MTSRTACSFPPGTPLRSPARSRRVLDDDALRARLAAATRPSIAAIGRESDLRAPRARPAGGGSLTRRGPLRRARTAALPLAAVARREMGCARRGVRPARAQPGHRIRRPAVSRSCAAARSSFYPRLPIEVAQELRSFRPHAVIAADPFVAAGCSARAADSRRRDAKVIVEVHGDPRDVHARLRVAGEARALAADGRRRPLRAAPRRCDPRRSRTSLDADRGHARTAGDRVLPDVQRPFGVSPIIRSNLFPTNAASCSSARSSSTRTSTGSRRPGAGSRRELPDATLVVVGKGSRQHVIDQLRRELPGRVEHHPELPPDGGRRASSTGRGR